MDSQILPLRLNHWTTSVWWKLAFLKSWNKLKTWLCSRRRRSNLRSCLMSPMNRRTNPYLISLGSSLSLSKGQWLCKSRSMNQSTSQVASIETILEWQWLSLRCFIHLSRKSSSWKVHMIRLRLLKWCLIQPLPKLLSVLAVALVARPTPEWLETLE